MRQFLMVDPQGHCTTERQVDRLPAMLARGFRGWEILLSETDVPSVGSEVTIDAGTLVQETRTHSVSLGGVEIGTGQSRALVP